MKIDLAKLPKQAALVLGWFLVVLGLLMNLVATTALQQNTGMLTAIFGLLLAWFIIWLRRGK